MSKKTRANTRIKATVSSFNQITEETYQLTTAPILDQRFHNLPQEIQDEFNQLSQTAETNGAEVIPRLLELIQLYPLSLIYSCLAIAYGQVDPEKQKQVIIENYQKNPKNLFARCNYARLCLAEKNAEEVAKIFNGHFELKPLYPKRSEFHITEFTALTSVACDYYFQQGEIEQAEALYTKLKEIAPESAETRLIKTLLHPTVWQKINKKFFA